MSKHFFAADAHLEPDSKPRTWQLFLSFLDFVRHENGNLYILGDLVNYWANNKLIKTKYQPLFEKLDAIAKNGEVGLLIGNRDFLLKKSYLNQWGIDFFGENQLLSIDGRQIFVTHGDIFWDSDASYQRFKKIGWPALRQLDAITPAIIANQVARGLRKKSKKAVPQKPAKAKVMNEQLVHDFFQEGIDVLICGHIHKPEIKNYPQEKQLIILPDWNDAGGGYCLLSDGKLDLVDYR